LPLAESNQINPTYLTVCPAQKRLRPHYAPRELNMGLVIRPLVTFPLHKLILLRTVLQRFEWIASKVAEGKNVAAARREVIREQNLKRNDLPCARKLSGMCKAYLGEAICFVFGASVTLCVRNGRGEAKGLTDEGLLFLAEVSAALEHLRTRAHQPIRA
jgi:hypothetical protein